MTDVFVVWCTHNLCTEILSDFSAKKTELYLYDSIICAIATKPLAACKESTMNFGCVIDRAPNKVSRFTSPNTRRAHSKMLARRRANYTRYTHKTTSTKNPLANTRRLAFKLDWLNIYCSISFDTGFVCARQTTYN